MTVKTIFYKEKIWLALIPVLGSIIITIITSNSFSCNKKPDPEIAKVSLRNKAGKINELVSYNEYNELYPMFSAGLKPYLTKALFESATDTMQKALGNYVKIIDTTESVFNGIHTYYVKNQRQNGQSITIVTFDDKGDIFGLFISKVQK